MPALPLHAWLGLAVVAYVLVTCVLRTLAGVARRQIEIHDLIYKSHALRRQYVEAVLKRRAMGGSAEIVEE